MRSNKINESLVLFYENFSSLPLYLSHTRHYMKASSLSRRFLQSNFENIANTKINCGT